MKRVALAADPRTWRMERLRFEPIDFSARVTESGRRLFASIVVGHHALDLARRARQRPPPRLATNPRLSGQRTPASLHGRLRPISGTGGAWARGAPLALTAPPWPLAGPAMSRNNARAVKRWRIVGALRMLILRVASATCLRFLCPPSLGMLG